MKQVTLAGMEISRIGLGAWAIGGPWEYGWGAQDDAESLATIHRALELGVNWIDTAPVYGLGHSERLVGLALRETSLRPLVFTKGGIPWDADGKPDHVITKDSLLREFDASCERLGVETIDLYQIHWPVPDDQVEQSAEALGELLAAGRIRRAGVSNFSVDQLERARRIAPIATLQSPYSLIDRGLEETILPYCAEHEIGVINYSPMGSGMLTGKVSRAWVDALPEGDWRRTKSDHFREPKLTDNLQVADRVRRIADERDEFPGAIAVAWTLRHAAVTASIVGARRPEQVEDLVAAADLTLTEQEASFLADG